MNHRFAVRRFARVLILAATVTAGPAAAQHEDAAPNTLGLYLTEQPGPVIDFCYAGESNYTGAPGAITVYAVLRNPWNPDLGAPMTQVGGFAFRLVIPEGVYLLDTTYPPGTACGSGPDFVVSGAAIPVADGTCTLATLSLGEFTGATSAVFLAPTDAGACVAGALTVSDATDPPATFSLSPSSGFLDVPIFYSWLDCGLPAEDEAWGAVQALYR